MRAINITLNKISLILFQFNITNHNILLSDSLVTSDQGVTSLSIEKPRSVPVMAGF